MGIGDGNEVRTNISYRLLVCELFLRGLKAGNGDRKLYALDG